MRGAFGKPLGTVARVDIGQILFSIRTKDASREHAVEAFRRCKYKFPGQQKIIVSNKWGFTDLSREEYTRLKSEDRIIVDGATIKVHRFHGPLGSKPSGQY